MRAGVRQCDAVRPKGRTFAGAHVKMEWNAAPSLDWEIPPKSELLLLHCLGTHMTDAHDALRRHANRVMETWARDNHYDLQWSWVVDAEVGSHIVKCVDLLGSVSVFPRAFQNEFVGKLHQYSNTSWLLSTVSTK